MPLSDDSTIYKSSLDSLTGRYQRDIARIKEKSFDKNSKYLSGLYKDRYDHIKEIFTEGGILTNPEANLYLQSLVGIIRQYNPEVRKLESRVLFCKAYWPNAASMGEGTILFNIGLFNRLQNEAQVVFILCHELAHLYFDQGNKALEVYVNTVYSEEFQKELKNIQRSSYNKGQQLQTLARNITFNSRRHNREHESEADSMALEWMKNTPFDLHEALNCLALLDSVDLDKYDVPLNLVQVLQTSRYPFQSRWLRQNLGLAAMADHQTKEEKIVEDSLKTHPDCQQRIIRLQGRVALYQRQTGIKFLRDQQEFEKLGPAFDIEIIWYCLKTGLVSRCLYLSLEMLPVYSDNAYVFAMIEGSLNKCYDFQKKHELSHIADLPAPDFEKKYDSLLYFIQNLRLPEWAALSYYFGLDHQDRFKDNEEFLHQLISSKENFEKPEEKKQWVDYYFSHFPKRKYSY
jgi:Zn-dependent protease with chaperone function